MDSAPPPTSTTGPQRVDTRLDLGDLTLAALALLLATAAAGASAAAVPDGPCDNTAATQRDRRDASCALVTCRGESPRAARHRRRDRADGRGPTATIGSAWPERTALATSAPLISAQQERDHLHSGTARRGGC
jgi:hypothetical protein